MENINIGDLFEAGHNLEGWISSADQCMLPRKHTTWNSNKRADGGLMYLNVYEMGANAEDEDVRDIINPHSCWESFWKR